MKILSQINRIAEFNMSTRDKQRTINVSEAFHLWNHLVQRYNTLLVTETLEMFVRDDDFKLILAVGKKALEKNIKILEQEMLGYGIPLPVRPPKQTHTTAKLEEVSDRHIFRRILRGIQSFLPTHTIAFVHSTSPKIRELFMSFLIDEMKIYDKYMEYGKLKGYEVKPPMYKV